jgi:acyl-CoA thioesterase
MSELDLAKRCAEAMYAEDVAARELGITIEIVKAGSALARFEVRQSMVNGFGVCHGGFLFTLADTAFAYACNAYDRVSLAAAASIEFLKPAKLGDRLTAEVSQRWRGKRSGIYDVAVANQAGETIALFRGRSHVSEQSVLPAPPKPDTENLEIGRKP